ncbi:UNVERIFIED_CONTAM: Transmembrane 7 superfamily member 3 [Trichonephila clavipes]
MPRQSLNGSQENITLSLKTDGNSKIVTIPQNSTGIIHVVDIPVNVAVLIYQAHSHTENLTMSEQPKALIHNSATGRNIGLAVKLHNTASENQVWLSNFNQQNVHALIVLTTLDSFGPIPGGCNMEFATEIAPYLRLKSDTLKVYLEYQHASFGSSRDEPATKCGLSLPYITYEFYVLFLEENNFGEEEYFKKVEYMSNVSSIKSHSSKCIFSPSRIVCKTIPYVSLLTDNTEVHNVIDLLTGVQSFKFFLERGKTRSMAKSYSLHPDTRFSFMMYPNLGVVYNVIAKYTINNEVKEAAYIPVVSYGCSPLDFTENGCRFLSKERLVPFFGLLISFLIGFILIGKYCTFTKEIKITLTSKC